MLQRLSQREVQGRTIKQTLQATGELKNVAKLSEIAGDGGCAAVKTMGESYFKLRTTVVTNQRKRWSSSGGGMVGSPY